MKLELRNRVMMFLICGCLVVTGCLGNHKKQKSDELPDEPGITLTYEPPPGTATRTLMTRNPDNAETSTSFPLPTMTRRPSPTYTRVLPALTETSVRPTLSPSETPIYTRTPIPAETPHLSDTSIPETPELDQEIKNRREGLVYAKDGKFWKVGENGIDEPFVVFGMNRYNLFRNNETNNGCGNEFSDEELEPWFAGLQEMGVNVVRTWVFQDYMQEQTPEDAVDNRFDQFDKVLEIAGRFNIALLPVMRNQWKPCDDRYFATEFLDENGNTNNAWYTDGYKVANGIEPKSYKEYVKEFTERYKGDPRIFAISLMNEPEGDFAALYAFAEDMTDTINEIDPDRLITLGTLGGGQPGTGGEFYEGLGNVPDLDILEFHDYTPEETIPGDEWNGPGVNLETAERLNKPIIVGELGITADCDDCYDLEERAVIFEEKIEAYLEKGADGVIFWSGPETINADVPDYYAINFDDPAADVIRNAALINEN